jgi:hypothetical protein
MAHFHEIIQVKMSILVLLSSILKVDLSLHHSAIKNKRNEFFYTELLTRLDSLYHNKQIPE